MIEDDSVIIGNFDIKIHYLAQNQCLPGQYSEHYSFTNSFTNHKFYLS